MLKLTKGNFAIELANFNGYYDIATNWNGWEVPYFELDEANKVMQWVAATDKNITYKWDNIALHIITAIEGAEAETVISEPIKIECDGKEYIAYSIGGFEWCWSLVAEAESTLDKIPTTLEEAKAWLKNCTEYIGMGFHPDTDFADYIDVRNPKEGLYDAEHAFAANEAMDAAMELFDIADEDIYEYCIEQL